MALFGYNHKQISKKLYAMAYDGSVDRENIVEAVHAKYYPRIDSEYDCQFLLRIVYRFGERINPLLDEFIKRGMDLRAEDSEGNTWLHHLMRQAFDSDTAKVIGCLVSSDWALPFEVQNNNGKRPLDVMIPNDISYAAKKHLFEMISAEAREISRSSLYEDHLHSRFLQFLEHLSAEDMHRFVDTGVKFDKKAGSPEKTILMHIVESDNTSVIYDVLTNDHYKLKKTAEPVLETALERGFALELVMRIVEKHGYEVTQDIVLKSIERTNANVLEYLYTQHCAQEEHDAEYISFLSQLVAEKIVQTKNLGFVLNALDHKSIGAHIDINAPLIDGNSLFLHAVSAGEWGALERLVACGADIRLRNAKGMSALDIAYETKQVGTLAFLEAELKKLNQRGDFERVDETQITYKKGVLTYVFDFYARQVVVRDHDTKAIAMVPFVEFAKSGSELLSEAAETLTSLDGNTSGFNAPHALSVAISHHKPVIRKPAGGSS